MNARTLTILAALAAAAAGCVPNDASIRVFGLCTPPTPNDVGGCLYPNACETLALGRLEADVASTNIDGPLIWPVQIDNQRASNADRAGGVETAYANIHGYKIRYGSADLLPPPDQDAAALPGEQTVDPSGSTVVLIPVINRAAGTLLAQRVAGGARPELSAEIRVYGEYGDGSSFETGPFTVQATLCNGCIPDADLDPTTYCKDDTLPVFVGACPQERQRNVPLCKAAPTP